MFGKKNKASDSSQDTMVFSDIGATDNKDYVGKAVIICCFLITIILVALGVMMLLGK